MNSIVKDCNYTEVIYPDQVPNATFIHCLDHYGPFPNLEITNDYSFIVTDASDNVEWS